MTIKEIIKSTGWTVKQFGEYFGIPPRTVENWLYRGGCPDYVVKLLAEKLDKDKCTK